MGPYLGIACCVVGLYGLISGNFLPGLLFVGAGTGIAGFSRRAGRDSC